MLLWFKCDLIINMRDKEVVDLPQDSPDGYWELEFKIPTTPNIDTS